MTSDHLETRLRDGLGGTAERAPHPTDLAAGARARLRRRRRTTATVVAAALAVAAVPVGLSVLGGPDRPDRDVTTVSEPPSGWRTETWRDLSVDVPPEWGYGGTSDWCADGRTLDEAVQVSRPGGVVPAIGCSPATGYGAHFTTPSSGELPPGTDGTVQQYSGDRYPDGAWIGYAGTQQAAVWVVTDDRALTRQVLDSATPVGEVDANGCATRREMLTPFTSDLLSVCRYESDGWLEQSELLSSADSEAARDTVSAAPGSSCERSATDAEVVTLRSAGFGFSVVLADGCAFVTDDAGTTKQATPEVLYWALSPGWSGELSFLSYEKNPEPLELREE